MFMYLLHNSSRYTEEQSHLKEPGRFWHVPPLWQGLSKHSLTSSSQLSPVQPVLHSHLMNPGRIWHVPPFWQGFLRHPLTSSIVVCMVYKIKKAKCYKRRYPSYPWHSVERQRSNICLPLVLLQHWHLMLFCPSFVLWRLLVISAVPGLMWWPLWVSQHLYPRQLKTLPFSFGWP